MECYHRNQRSADCHWIWAVSFVFCCRDCKDLWQLYGYEEAGACPQSLYPVCSGTRRHYVWHGTDDSAVFHCAGDCVHHHGTVRYDKRGCDRTSGRDCGEDRSGGNAGIYSLVDCDLAWKPFDYGVVLHYDPYRIWKDV